MEGNNGTKISTHGVQQQLRGKKNQYRKDNINNGKVGHPTLSITMKFIVWNYHGLRNL